MKRFRDKLKKQNETFTTLIKNEQEKAKKLLKENQRDKAKFVWRQKRFHEKLLIESTNKLAEIEQIIDKAEHQQLMDEINRIQQISQRLLSESNDATFDAEQVKKKLNEALTSTDEQKVKEEMNEFEEELEQTISK